MGINVNDCVHRLIVMADKGELLFPAINIMVPILPGIMPLNAYGGFKRMTGFCKTRIPPTMAEEIEKFSGDDKKQDFTNFGVAYMVALCQKLIASKLVPGLHFYCLNQSERSYAILEKLGFLKKPMGEPIAQMAATAGSVPANVRKNVEASGDFKVADMSLADFGRKEYDLAEFEMPGLMSCRKEFGPAQPSRVCASWARCT